MEFAGEFETHLTIEAAGPHRLEALRRWAAARGLKCVHVVLDGGDRPSQPMLTRRGDGGLSGQIAAARSLAAELLRDGFPVRRVKVEAAPENADVPRSDEEVAAQPPERHFEHHVKLLLPPEADRAAVSEAARPHGGRLSRNAFRARSDGLEERFVTQRCYRVASDEAGRRLAGLLAAVEPFGHPVVDVEREYVVYDTDAGLDAGWLEPPES